MGRQARSTTCLKKSVRGATAPGIGSGVQARLVSELASRQTLLDAGVDVQRNRENCCFVFCCNLLFVVVAGVDVAAACKPGLVVVCVWRGKADTRKWVC